MPVNPMQKKARNSFLLGMLMTLIICILIGAIVYFLVLAPGTSGKGQKGASVKAYALNTDVKSGQEITEAMLTKIDTYQNLVPQNYVSVEQIRGVAQGKKVIAKIDMYKNTLLTASTVTTEENGISNDLRKIEYNMLTLPININTGDLIDVRITFSNGQDLIVLSKKEIKNIEGNTVTFYLTEDEILLLNSAIVESYIMTASNIYVAKYTDPGMQEKATITYMPTSEVLSLINSDSNIVEKAKNGIIERYKTDIRGQMNSAINQYSENALTNIETGIKKQIENAQKAREEYLTGIEQQAQQAAQQ